MISARLLCQGVTRSAWDPKTSTCRKLRPQPHGVRLGQAESGGIVLAAVYWARAPRVVLPDRALCLPTSSGLRAPAHVLDDACALIRVYASVCARARWGVDAWVGERVGGRRVGVCLRGYVRQTGSEGIPKVGIGFGGQGRQRHKVLRRQFPQKRPIDVLALSAWRVAGRDCTHA